MSVVEIHLSLPLDSDGFLRRACPTCSREFKWFSSDAEAEGPAAEEFFCPYCGVPAAPDEWFTLEQSTYIEAEVLDQALSPSLDELRETTRQLNRSSGGLIELRASLEVPERRQADPVFEPNDMRQVAVACHPTALVKVNEAWECSVYCLLCGRPSDAASQ